MDIGGWLRSLGLEGYEAAFRENEIDEAVLLNLTVEDLKELGVSLVGHRRKLLDAIVALRANSNSEAPRPALAAPTPTNMASADVPAPESFGERRYLTVMFCDLVGSTGIAAKLDAEEWRDLVGGYLGAAAAAVTEMGGHVAKKLGDGLMALFGYPIAQENDAERAARAALAIQRALVEINHKNAGTDKPALSARIGLDAGPVVVDAAGEIFGDAPNVAARVQALAEPGAVLVTARVQRQVTGLFVSEERGPHSLKGVPEPTILFRLVRASGGGRRAGQRHLTPLVGRDEEIAMLMRRWERARQGDGQLVLIVGEPGLGKSRLVEEFHIRLRDTLHTWAEWSCSQLLQTTPLHPMAEWGRQRFGGTDVDAVKRLADLENLLGLIKLDPEDNAPLLAPLLDIPLPPERTLAFPPEELRRRQLAALTTLVIAGARSQPVVLALEDMHWADPTTLDLLRNIAERAAQAPLFVLMTARPEFRPQWDMRAHHATISLAPLDRHQVQHMVGEISACRTLPKEVIDGITERTGGVPLFVEEVTRLLLERGDRSGNQAIPPTLQHSLTARIDRLGPARELAQIGAVIGRDFSYAILRTVTGMEDVALQAALDRLAEADVLLVQGLPPESEYRFKHALIQDAAYENLLKSRRQALHRRVGEALRDHFAGTSAAQPELLARHFTQAGMTEAAIEWWGKAGQRSLERSALVEAAQQFTYALDKMAVLPSTPAQRREQIKLQVALANALMHTKGYAAPDTKACLDQARLLITRAEALGEPSEDNLLLFSILYGFWVTDLVAFNGDAALSQAMKFLAMATKQRATVPVMIGHRLVATSLLLTGSIAESRVHFDQAIALYDPVKHRPLATQYGQDIRTAGLSFRSWALWSLGYPESALADAEYATSDAREAQAASLMHALTLVSITHILCGNYAAATAAADEGGGLAEEKGTLIWNAWIMMYRGCLLAVTGNASTAIEMITSGIRALRSTRATLHIPLVLPYLARAYADFGQFEQAWNCIGEALTEVETTKYRWCEADIHRTAGEIALMAPVPDEAKAEAYFDRALAVARERQAKSWELRAAMSMARLRRDQGKRREAHELLAPIYIWFTEGSETLDLKEAKALLYELVS
jgi:class 3 adenylate cyclase/predicted ATPase